MGLTDREVVESHRVLPSPEAGEAGPVADDLPEGTEPLSEEEIRYWRKRARLATVLYTDEAGISADIALRLLATIDSLQETIKVERERRVEAEERAERSETHAQEVISDCDEYQRTVAALRAKREDYRVVVEAARAVDRANHFSYGPSLAAALSNLRVRLAAHPIGEEK
jgi:phage shock protein A